ncbi:hypothetical protein NX794_26560 [Streptomyces sp. LP11]|uniref:Secreted protein n=1 Tax=Streptomyces pyxinicus TaxID=2970331 RepID=A0ABT2B8A4_9ACTN|nr:hypothetical protein [Streptomyces sp. LP11]MCS0604753.1 hypothetical protein [Streptomyces sp. LP11]
MQLRHTLGAAAGALLLALVVPTSAHAATGDFVYRTSTGHESGLANPRSGVCTNLAGTSAEHPGHSPWNLTNSTATVFLEPDCEGDTFYVMNPGKKLGSRLKLSSVVFS